MLFKLSLSNLKRSIRDYAVYFFTIVIGVSVFYVFNAISEQSAFMKLGEDTRQIVELIGELMSGISVFVAVVLGLLIVYASRFLMKRRSREFALYMILGMGKAKISAILLIETVMIGIGSLAVGLAAGLGLSQVMSAVVASLFEADMTEYKFVVSWQAIGKTILYFSVMYIVVMIFNSIIISKSKLLNLINSGKKSEKLRLKNPIIRAIIFIIAASALGYAYHKLLVMTTDIDSFTLKAFSLLIVIGSVSTLLIFYSISGLILFIVQKMKKLYYSGLNSFTFRQISSRISTMVLSMTVICLMLFVTICSLCSAISMRNSLNENLRKCCPADAEIYMGSVELDKTVIEALAESGYDLTEDFIEYAEYNVYYDESFTFKEFSGQDRFESSTMFLDSSAETIISQTDYNKVAELYGREKVQLNDNEFILLCNYKVVEQIRNSILKDNNKVTIFGYELTSQTDKCVEASVFLETQQLNMGIFIVPDNVVAEQVKSGRGFVGNFPDGDKDAKLEANKLFIDKYNDAMKIFWKNKDSHKPWHIRANTKVDLSIGAVGLGAIATFVGLYLGLIFLVSCGAILALKQLSESTDNIDKYVMLRKLGAAEDEISRSLLVQCGIFFLLPLLLAILHSYFGMKFAGFILESMGINGMWQSVAITSVFILLIYGGYFLITYFTSRFIIKARR